MMKAYPRSIPRARHPDRAVLRGFGGTRWAVLAVLLLPYPGCAGLYFRDAGEPPTRAIQYGLAQWPYSEYWTGIVFNGKKIGFTHLTLSPSGDEAGRFDIRSEAGLRFRFLAVDKRVTLRSFDRVARDLSLDRFAYDYDLDGNRLQISGRLSKGVLEVTTVSKGRTTTKALPVGESLYPTSAMGLYPLLRGLALGNRYEYRVYDGETGTLTTVTQEVLAFEESDLFPGKAFKVRSELHGQESFTWMGTDGRPLIEMSMGGVLIAGLETEKRAKTYLTLAALNKEETLLQFSLIRSDRPLEDPAGTTAMEVTLYGLGGETVLPADQRQRCERRGEKVICRIRSRGWEGHSRDGDTAPRGSTYLEPSSAVPSTDPVIREKAAEIAADARTPLERAQRLIEWIRAHIAREPVDVFSALDVLAGKKAECQGHTYLYAAFARALGIPTRVVNGIVYSGRYQGFLYHTWAESLLEGRWMAVDPTFAQMPADATHVKFVEGERMADLLPLVEFIGKLHAEIGAVVGE